MGLRRRSSSKKKKSPAECHADSARLKNNKSAAPCTMRSRKADTEYARESRQENSRYAISLAKV